MLKIMNDSPPGEKNNCLFIAGQLDTLLSLNARHQHTSFSPQPTFLPTKQVKWQTKCIQIKIKIQILHSTPPI